jgi:ABC-2 type transport system ATP-binding protein
MKMIEAKELTKFYGKFLAVDHISLEVNEGEIFGFLGPNGAGKTTTIKMLNTLTRISEGRAFINGYDVSKYKNQVRRSIGLVPQDLTLDRDMTGRDNLRIQAKLYDIPEEYSRKKQDELLRLVDLYDVAGREVAKYSWGMQKRLELIMGLIHTPKVLFLDEPTLGLDAQSRALIWEYIRKLNHDFSVTVFLTTHYLEEADELCDRIAIIDEGKLRAEGSPSQLKDSLGEEMVELQLAKPCTELRLETILEPLAGVIKVSSEGTFCRVQTKGAEALMPKLAIALNNEGIEIKRMNVRKVNLNQVFIKHVTSNVDSIDNASDEFKMLARERLLKQRT